MSRRALNDALEVRDSFGAADRERANAIVHVLFERAQAEPDPDVE